MKVLRLFVRERIVMAVILLNAITVFLHAFQDIPQDWRLGLYWIDYGCALFFVVELSTKVGLRGWERFWRRGWNRFDFVVVVLSLPFLLSPMPFVNLEGFSAILLLRLGRVFRVLRLFHFIPNRTEIQRGITRALRASLGVFLAIFLYTFILTLFSHSLFHDHAPSYFGDPLLSMYSMFQIFTVEGWYEIPNQIARQSGWVLGAFARVYFSFSVLTGGIIGLSLANAVFVDEMVIDNTRHIESDLQSLKAQVTRHMEQSKEHRRELEELIRDLHRQIDSEETGDSSDSHR